MLAKKLKAFAFSAVLGIGFSPDLVHAQPPAPPKTAYKVPRDAYGHPDLQGVWTNVAVTRLERNPKYGASLVLTEAEARKIEAKTQAQIDLGNKPTDPNAKVTDLPADCSGGRGTDCNYNAAWTDPGSVVMRVNGQPRNGFITSTPDGRVPMRKDVHVNPFGRSLGPGQSPSDNPETRALGERCLLSFGNSAGPVMLPGLYNNTYQFVQTKDQVVIDVEMVHDARIVRLDTPQHLPASVRPWMGDSIGRWEGDTLVVETTNFNPEQVFRGASQHLKVTERFTRTDKDRMHYAFWVEDPTVFAQAWGGEYEFSRITGQVYEYACHEGNYGLVGILQGAREEERTGHKTSPTNIDQKAKATDAEDGEG
ncbi:hypothetical protein [Phenylobacterium sp.]|jgi:hypothetical protein|uniref:hypothetical protein n=1 Tax=Phenylobacterium sp. TaxID=1871053 RepID=UPI0011F46CFA|nr:hypothetical protein [Phenylobacterium sp.]THD63763.1 MAG: hypothetical protein E8A12_08565 [Phenylobacterium sp.]